jgi:hypothetical protein
MGTIPGFNQGCTEARTRTYLYILVQRHRLLGSLDAEYTFVIAFYFVFGFLPVL